MLSFSSPGSSWAPGTSGAPPLPCCTWSRAVLGYREHRDFSARHMKPMTAAASFSGGVAQRVSSGTSTVGQIQCVSRRRGVHHVTGGATGARIHIAAARHSCSHHGRTTRRRLEGPLQEQTADEHTFRPYSCGGSGITEPYVVERPVCALGAAS